jgi:hypothetical protein
MQRAGRKLCRAGDKAYVSLPGRLVRGPCGRLLRPRSVRRDTNLPHFWAAFTSLRMTRSLCTSPLERGADAFLVRAVANGREASPPLEMPNSSGGNPRHGSPRSDDGDVRRCSTCCRLGIIFGVDNNGDGVEVEQCAFAASASSSLCGTVQRCLGNGRSVMDVCRMLESSVAVVALMTGLTRSMHWSLLEMGSWKIMVAIYAAYEMVCTEGLLNYLCFSSSNGRLGGTLGF